MTLEDRTAEVTEIINRAALVTLETLGLFVVREAKLRCPLDTGNLMGKITHQTDINQKTVDIGTNVEYALKMEKGGSTQAPDGYLTPAVEQNMSDIYRIIQICFRDVVSSIPPVPPPII